jgi:fumarate reductase iron-sulfur subunit
MAQAATGRTMTLQVSRYDPVTGSEPIVVDYTVPYAEDMVVLDALNWIKDEIDGSLSYRWSCRMGICGSCGMSVNRSPKLSCSAFLRDYLPGPVRVEPLRNLPIISDLVVDISDPLAKIAQVKPWIIRQQGDSLANGEHRQTPGQAGEFRQLSACINCMLCYSACPVYALEPEFLGPAAIALARRYNLDSRDEGSSERLPVIASSAGIWDCTFVGECSVVCPKGVDPAKAIQQSKLETTLALLTPFAKR